MHGPIFTAEEKAGACRPFFGRDTLGDELQAVADNLRAAIVRFATTGAPAHYGGVPWRVAHGAEGDVFWRLQPVVTIRHQTARHEIKRLVWIHIDPSRPLLLS